MLKAETWHVAVDACLLNQKLGYQPEMQLVSQMLID